MYPNAPLFPEHQLRWLREGLSSYFLFAEARILNVALHPIRKTARGQP
jgi:hypothetical protein